MGLSLDEAMSDERAEPFVHPRLCSDDVLLVCVQIYAYQMSPFQDLGSCLCMSPRRPAGIPCFLTICRSTFANYILSVGVHSTRRPPVDHSIDSSGVDVIFAAYSLRCRWRQQGEA